MNQARPKSVRLNRAARTGVVLTVLLVMPVLAACDRDDSQSSPAMAEMSSASPTSAASPLPVARGTPAIAASPQATPSAELRRKAEQPAFPQGEVVHITMIQEPLGLDDPAERAERTERTEIWLDQTSGDAVKRVEDSAGTLRMLTVRKGLTLDQYRGEGDTTALTRWRVLAPDDPRLHDVTSDLTDFRELILRGA